jgi:hypothetical protein
LSLGFGPKRGLLAEDTLKLSVNVADVVATVGAIDQIQEMFKQKKDHVKQKKEEVGWGPSAMPRVSNIRTELTRLFSVLSSLPLSPSPKLLSLTVSRNPLPPLHLP